MPVCMVAYAQGHAATVKLLDEALQKLGLKPSQLNSTLGRTLGRALESQLMARRMTETFKTCGGDQRGRCEHLQPGTLGTWHLAEKRSGGGVCRGRARHPQPLGADRKPQDQPCAFLASSASRCLGSLLGTEKIAR